MQTNPFIRGFEDFHIQRKVIIEHGSDMPLAYRSLHSSQEHHPNNSLEMMGCVFGERYAFMLDDKDHLPVDIQNHCTDFGIVKAICYEVVGVHDCRAVDVGHYPSLDSAKTVIEQLRFQTGHYSRCWEISNSHVTEDEFTYLANLAGSTKPTGLPYEVFSIPASRAIGIKLIATPWGSDGVEQLFDTGVPSSLAALLVLAGQADTRILILDPDATVLDGLAVFNW